MKPLEIIARREARVDKLIDRVEAGELLTADDWRKLDQLNTLDMMSADNGAALEILARENDADGVPEIG